MYLTLPQELPKGVCRHFVNNAIVSGEVQQTLVGLASLWKCLEPPEGENQSAPTIDPGGPAQDAIPSSVQQNRGPSPVENLVRESDASYKPDAGGGSKDGTQ